MKITLINWKMKDGKWTRVEETLLPYPDDTRVYVKSLNGIDLDTVTWIKALGQEKPSLNKDKLMPDWDGRVPNREHPGGTTD